MSKNQKAVIVSVVIVCLFLVGALFAAVSGRIQVIPKLLHTGPAGLTAPSESLQSVFNWAATSGTNTDQMNILYLDQRTITSNSSEELDLYGVLLDNFGTTMNFARVKMMIVLSDEDNLQDIVVGGSTNGAFTNWCGNTTDVIHVRAGGSVAFFAPDAVGYIVSNGVSDQLKVSCTATNTSTYDIYIGGSSQ